MGPTLGQTLRQLRKASGSTLDEVARQAGVTAAAVSLFENGKRYPSPQVLGRLAASLNYPVEELVALMDAEKTADRLVEARSSQDEAHRTSGTTRSPRAQAQMQAESVRFSPQPIESLFGEAPSSVDAFDREPPLQPAPQARYSGLNGPPEVRMNEWASHASTDLSTPTRQLRWLATSEEGTSRRLAAVEALGDEASLALRTLRGLAADEDPHVARAARQALRELGVANLIDPLEPSDTED